MLKLVLNPWTGEPYSQRLDPELSALLAVQKKGTTSVDRYALPFPESRLALELERQRTRGSCIPMHRVEDEEFKANGRIVRLRWLRATPEESSSPTVVYLHGGGWCVGSNTTHDTVLRHLARATRGTVCGVEYSLAPEHPFPAAIEDTKSAVDYIHQRAGVAQDRSQLVLAGDSAGANLALVEAMRRRDEGLVGDLASLLLYYGCFGPVREGGSFSAYGDGRFGLSRQAQVRYLDAYLQSTERSDWRAFPLLGDLRGLPPTYVLAAELDPLFDDSVDLHRALVKNHVESQLSIAKGMPHGFLNQANQLQAASRAIEMSAEFLGKVIASIVHR